MNNTDDDQAQFNGNDRFAFDIPCHVTYKKIELLHIYLSIQFTSALNQITSQNFTLFFQAIVMTKTEDINLKKLIHNTLAAKSMLNSKTPNPVPDASISI